MKFLQSIEQSELRSTTSDGQSDSGELQIVKRQGYANDFGRGVVEGSAQSRPTPSILAFCASMLSMYDKRAKFSPRTVGHSLRPLGSSLLRAPVTLRGITLGLHRYHLTSTSFNAGNKVSIQGYLK